MTARSQHTNKPKTAAAFTLVEVVLSVAILALAMAGMIYGYVQTNYQTEWSSMSLAAQSFAVQAVEQARAAQWDYFRSHNNQIQNLQSPKYFTNAMLIASSGRTTNVVTTLTVNKISTGSAPLYQFRADCVWYFPRTGAKFTNSVVTQRAPDQ